MYIFKRKYGVEVKTFIFIKDMSMTSGPLTRHTATNHITRYTGVTSVYAAPSVTSPATHHPSIHLSIHPSIHASVQPGSS